MFNFKRIFSLFTALVLVFSLVACSKMDPNYGKRNQENKPDSQASKSNYDEDVVIMSSDRVMPNYFDISLFDEENYSEIYLGKKFEIEAAYLGDTFPVPVKIEELEALGWTLSKGNEYDKNSLVFSYETIDAVFENEDGRKIKAQFYNSSRSSVKLSECYIVKFRIENNFYKNSKDYSPFNINGITNTMAITDIVDTLGTPSHFYAVSEKSYYLDYFISKKDRRNGITVYVNPVDDIITAIEFSYYK